MMELTRRFKPTPIGILLFAFLCSTVHGAAFPSGFYNDDSEELELFKYLRLSNPFLEGIDGDLERSIVERNSIPSYFENFLNLIRSQQEPIPWEKLFDGVNDDCRGHVLEWLWRVVNRDNETINLASERDKWVLQMPDAWGKIPEGILSGHVNAFGDFDECVGIEARNITPLNEYVPNLNISTDFEGRYCMSFIVDYNTAMLAAGRNLSSLNDSPSTFKRFFESRDVDVKGAVSLEEFGKILLSQAGMMGAMMPSFAVCMPNSCSQGEIQRFLVNTLEYTYTTLKLNATTSLYPLAVVCAVKEKDSFTAGDISVIALLSVIFGVSLGAGIIDFWLNYGIEKPQRRGTAYQYFMAFSLYTNTKKWMSTRKGSEDMGCIHGIRFFSTSWVVLGHTYAASIMVPAFNMIDTKKIHEQWSLMPILNGTFSVDTFFVMSGMLATYGILKTLDKTKGKLNLVMFYIHRYLRLTPTYAILVGIMATIVVYLGSGPYWNLLLPMQIKMCQDNWWTNLLYINNIVLTMNDMCHGETWYISNDMQFYVLSPLIVYPLWKWQKSGAILLTVYTILSCVSPVLVLHYNDAAPAALMTRPLNKGFTEIYIRPWARIQSYLVGIWLGWIIYKTRGKQIKIPGFAVALGWIASTAIALTVIFSIHRWFDPFYEIPKVGGYFYAGLSRFAWSLSVSWVIFACLKGYGGIVNNILSWSPFMPLGRLTFCVYLSSYYLQFMYHARSTIAIKYDTYNMINLFFAHQVMSFLVGFLLTMLFESPFIVLQKLLFEGAGPRSATTPQVREQKGPAQDPSKRHGIFYENTDAILNGGPVAINMNESEKDT